MFDYDQPDRQFSVGPFLLQLFGVPFVILFAGFVEMLFVNGILHAVGLLPMAHDSVPVMYLVYLCTGLLLGFAVQSGLPRAKSCGGCWVWILQLILLSWAFAIEPRRTSGVVGVFRAIFAEPLLLLVFTLPALGTCCYSLGVAIASQRQPATKT
jgi:hypothetical protein